METKKKENQQILLTSPLSSKAQITLPKPVRSLLRLDSRADMVGFIVDFQARTIRLTKIEPMPVDPDFTEDEYRKLRALRKAEGGKTFGSMEDLLTDLNGCRNAR